MAKDKFGDGKRDKYDSLNGIFGKKPDKKDIDKYDISQLNQLEYILGPNQNPIIKIPKESPYSKNSSKLEEYFISLPKRNKKDKKESLDKIIEKKYDIIHNLKNSLSTYITKDNCKIINKKIFNNLKIYNNLGNLYLSKKISKISLSNYGIGLQLDDSATVTADNIGEFVLPIVEFIRAVKPDYIVACDRGARLIGVATLMLHKALHGKLPTVDGTIRYQRFSRSVPDEQLEEHIRPFVKEMLKHRANPTVLVLDDWICSGLTRNLVENSFNRLSKGKIDVKYGVLLGSGADVSGASHSGGFAGTVEWRDDPQIIGVDYHGAERISLFSSQARKFRSRMHKGIYELVEKINAGKKVGKKQTKGTKSLGEAA